MKFKFNDSIVDINNKLVNINIKNKSKNDIFYNDFLDNLKKKYKDYNIKLNRIETKFVTKDKEYNFYNSKKLKVKQIIESIGRIMKIETVEKNGNVIYGISVKNLSEPSILKLYAIYEKEIDIKVNDIITYKGTVKELEKKKYENDLDYNKFVIKISELNKLDINIKNKISTSEIRHPLTISSNFGNGFITEDILKFRDDIEGYCIADNNSLNFVANQNKDLPLAINGYIKINEKYYSITIYLICPNTTVKYNNKDLTVNEGIRLLNKWQSENERYNNKTVFDILELLNNKDKFKIGSMDHNGLIYQSLFDNDYNLLEEYISLFDIVGIESIESLSIICKEGRKNGSLSKLKEVNKLIGAISLKQQIPLVFSDNAIVLNKCDRESAIEFIISEKIKEENIKDRDKFVKEQKENIKQEQIGYVYKAQEIIDELYMQGFDLVTIERILFDELMFYSTLQKKSEIQIIPNTLFVDDDKEEKKKLIDLFKKLLLNRKNEYTKDEIERLKEELKLVVNKNYQRVFLTSYIAIKRSNDLGYPTADRGTAGSMLLCHLLNISDTKPTDYGLDYRMFLGPNGEKVPDIDINISDEIVKNISDEINKYTGFTMKASISSFYKENSIKSQILVKTNPKDIDIDYTSLILSGKLARIQPHNSGIMLLPNFDIYYIFPKIKYNNEEISLYPYEFLEKNITKIDLLSKTDISFLKDLSKYKSLKDIELNDKKVYDYIWKDSSKISELNTDYARKIIDFIKPKSFDKLIIIQGLLHGKGVLETAFELARNKKQIISSRESLLKLLEKLLSDEYKNLSFGIMEKVRKGNQGNFTEEEINAVMSLPKEYQSAIFKIKYLFPKAHAISYSKQAYYQAYYEIYKNDILTSNNDISENEMSLDEIEELM